jgi:putative membrane protein
MYARLRGISVCFLAASLSLVASAKQNQSSGKVSAADQAFMKEAAQGGMAEVELGQLADQKASNEEVRKFGQRMIDDHGKANDQLKSLAANQGVKLPQTLDAKDRATKLRLSKLSGDQFDKAYMKDMVRDHKADIAAFRRESTSGASTDVKDFATQTLPTLQNHLKEAESIEPKVLQAKRGSM